VLADRLGEPTTIILGGGVCLAGAAWFATRLPRLRKLIRPIYLQQGIIAPPVVESTVQLG
jgi:hypothetical protein